MIKTVYPGAYRRIAQLDVDVCRLDSTRVPKNSVRAASSTGVDFRAIAAINSVKVYWLFMPYFVRAATRAGLKTKGANLRHCSRSVCYLALFYLLNGNDPHEQSIARLCQDRRA